MALLFIASQACLGSLVIVSLGAYLRERSRYRGATLGGALASRQGMEAVRLLRLAANEMRGLSLTLLAHAQTDIGPAASGAVAGLAHRLIAISEHMLRNSDEPGAQRTLDRESVLLMPVLEFAVAQVAASLGPSRRAWRLASVPDDTLLTADKRALNQILVHVLSSAATSTRDGDWIDVTLGHDTGRMMLMVEDEGAGLPVASADLTGPDGAGRENRGIGYGLALARTLMEAHGGSLDVISTAKVGTRVCLAFPESQAFTPG